MSKQIEALKLALEALEVATTPLARDRQEVLRAQAAIREALAEQPAQQQEPVAWLHPANATCVTTDPTAYARGIPLYTSPPASKPLTDEQQIAEALRRHGLTLVKTATGYDVLKLGQITAHGIKGNA